MTDQGTLDKARIPTGPSQMGIGIRCCIFRRLDLLGRNVDVAHSVSSSGLQV